jgi:hypothetical protein
MVEKGKTSETLQSLGEEEQRLKQLNEEIAEREKAVDDYSITNSAMSTTN